MTRAKTTLAWITAAAVAGAACAASPRRELRRPPPPERAAALISEWGLALRFGNDAALDDVEDRAGRAALVYVAIKLAASQTPDGAKAVEMTMLLLVLSLLVGALSDMPGPPETALVAVPTGELGPTLAAAGLVDTRTDDGRFALVQVPWRDTAARLTAGQARHRARLREAEAWTCGFVTLERVIDPTAPALVRAAELSTNVFAAWLDGVEAIWIVRAECKSGAALFVITAAQGEPAAARDRVLVAWVPTTQGVPSAPAP